MNIVSDTLFVVAGCYYEHDYWQEYDSSDSNQAEPDPAQKLCTMPTHQFKMALRTKSGSTGKRIQECTADELQAVGFWIETFTESPETSARAELRRLAVPVRRRWA
jgi:endonuclease G